MAISIYTAQAITRRDGGLACYGLAVDRDSGSGAALHTEWGVCGRSANAGAKADAEVAGLKAAVCGLEWYSASTSKLPVGEPVTLYVDRLAAASYIEQARSRMLTGRRSPSKLAGGQSVEFTVTIRLRTLLGKCRGLAVEIYNPHVPQEYQDALELAERSLVAELESSRSARVDEVELVDLGKGLFRASGRYQVDALLLQCGCKDFEITNAGRLGRYPVRCKHIFAAQACMGGPAAANASCTVPGEGGDGHVGTIGG